MTRKLLILSAVVVLACCFVTVTFSQNELRFRVDDLHERVVTLEQLPAKIATMDAKLDAMRDRQRERDSNSSTIETGLIVGVGILIAEKLFAVFGVRLKGN